MNMIPDKLLKPYDPKETEPRIYKLWEESGFFNPDVCIKEGIAKKDAETFSMVLPPPNITGRLHLGHTLEHSIQDAVVRFERMRGKRTLWVPGTDHAAIATQARFEKELYKSEGKSRHDFPRDEFFKMVHEFGLKNQKDMQNQMRLLGSSLDWSREAFTLDDKRALAVRTAFKSMYDAGLIYRGHRIVNWDPKGQTTISDDEIVYVEEKTKFYYFKYGPFTIGTSRPETKFGDKYVVMHPDDERYAQYKHGQKLTLEWINGQIEATIIKDSAIDMAFGTGVMTITPWHSVADFEIAERHKLDKEQIIDKYGKLLPVAGEFAGMKISEAREKIVEKLSSKGLVEKIEDYAHNIATAERSGGIIEPQIMQQWFIDVNKPIATHENKTLKQLMKEPVESGLIKIMPDHFGKIYFHWIDNLRDWCISRQIIYGHQIPVWYKGEEIYCGIEKPEGSDWTQDSDTLDTWFSSGLWTFSTLGWPEKTLDLETYHPNTFMDPGYEILFFWVARMIMISQFHLKQIPFKNVYIHGMVRDSKGQKFSKSLRNGVEPEEIINQFGTDALRMSVVVGVGPGNDVNFDTQKVKAYKLFANKIWNASRFVLENTEDADYEKMPELTEIDQKRVAELKTFVEEITKEMEEYKFYLVSEKIYHYFWHTFADVIIEESKKSIKEGDEKTSNSAKWTLLHILTTSLKILHPFMPFVTEEVWGLMPIKNKKLLLVESWPR
jgi:valyl-tRNA synthetase